MTQSFNYFRDPKSLLTMAFIVFLLVTVGILEPNWWPWLLLVAAGYAGLFYFMRKNP